MSSQSSIEWTNATWNPVTGCSVASAGCAHCYARRFAERFRGVPGHPFEQGFDLKLWPKRLEMPLTWKRPRLVFVNSMSDLFHEKVPLKYIKQVFGVIKQAKWHRFQMLTKRSERLAAYADQLEWPANLWMGVSVENSSTTKRIADLSQVPAAVRFVSAEPLLGPLGKLALQNVDWIIVGGESGPGARPMHEDWVVEIRDQCVAAKIPFFFKQWGGTFKKRNGRLLQGKEWDQMPLESIKHGRGHVEEVSRERPLVAFQPHEYAKAGKVEAFMKGKR